VSARSTLAFSSFSILLAACNSGGTAPEKPVVRSTSADAGELYLGLAPPADGFQLRTVGAEIGPGEEHEYCEAVQVPGNETDEYAITSIELANGPRSHHLALSFATRGSIAATHLESLGVGNHVECPGGALIRFGDGIEVIGTIQVPQSEVTLPPHVARKFHGQDYIVFDYHYANTDVEPLQARSAANFHQADPATIEHVAQTFFLNNLTIDVPQEQTASFTGECHFDVDVMVSALTRHTHHWGTDFSVWYSGGARDGSEIWTSHDWQSETEFSFAEPVLLKAGEGFRYRCSYANDTTRALRFGTSVSDEMCMLWGAAWEANASDHMSRPNCNISWVDGDGIGHPANEAGGFPKPSAADANVCTSAYGASIDDCGRCRCNSCATPVVKCASDPDCAPLLLCFASCTDDDCLQKCQGLLEQHSSADGLLTEVGECVVAECPLCAASPDAGAPGPPQE
jgi:hypothetical protein